MVAAVYPRLAYVGRQGRLLLPQLPASFLLLAAMAFPWLSGGIEEQGQWLHPTLGRIQQVSQSTGHTLYMKADGWACSVGSNVFGQLGLGTTRDEKEPVCFFKNVRQVAAGGTHSVLVQQDGVAWGFGRNDQGQVGDGTNLMRKAPRRVFPGVNQVAAGCLHTVFLMMDGTVKATGANHDGQLGDGYQLTRFNPVQAALVARTPITVEEGAHSENAGPPMPVREYPHVVSFTYAAFNDRVDAEVPLTGITKVAAGCYHTVYLRSDGTAFATGKNEDGQVGDSSRLMRKTPVHVRNEYGTVALENIVNIAANGSYSRFLQSDGTLWHSGLMPPYGGRQSRQVSAGIIQIV